MGIDWEEILDAEGEDMADAYVDAMPDDDYYNTDYGPTDEELDATIAEDEARYRAEGLKELYDDEQTPKDYDGLLNVYYDTLVEMDSLVENHEFEINDAQQVICQELKDLKKLLAVLKEHNIAIPEGIEERYRNRSNYELMNSINFKVEEEVKELVWKIQKEGETAEKAECPVPVYEDEDDGIIR